MSEALWVWSAALSIAAAIVLAYWIRFRGRLRADRERKAEATRLGIDRPATQFPYVDDTHCIGCAACVRACPEGDVLGVVGGTAVVVNGLRCVGHARCQEACPVGAIEVGLGDVKSRRDVPLLDESLETSVPGLFVAGELGGLALVRNAVEQGRRAVEAVAARLASRTPGAEPELVIVGAGPAGISAGLCAASRGIPYAIVEREPTLGGSLLHYPRRKMVLTQRVELPPWGVLDREEYSKEHLLQVFEEIVQERGLDIRFGEAVRGLNHTDGRLQVETSGATYRPRFAVLALGRRGDPRRLGVPGEELPKVVYRLIDARSFERRRVLIVGGGDSAAEAAIGLARHGDNEVTLSYRREKLVRLKRKNQDALEPLIERGRVRALMSSRVVEIGPESVRLATGDAGEPASEVTVEIPNDDVIVLIGGRPPFGLLRDAGIRFGGDG